MQNDGSFVVYSLTKIVWSSGTSSRNLGASLVLQENGELVIQAQNGSILWSTNSSSNCSGKLQLNM
jgi:hypothetical protein